MVVGGLRRGDDVNQRDEKEAVRLAVPGYTVRYRCLPTCESGIKSCANSIARGPKSGAKLVQIGPTGAGPFHIS